MHATIYGRGQMVIPAKARKEARIDTGDVVNVLPEGDGRLVLVQMEQPKNQERRTRFGSFAGKGNTHCFPSAGRFHARKSSKRLNSFRRDLPPGCQRADCRDLAGPSRPSPALRPGCAANKRQLARLANWASCESAAATHFHFRPEPAEPCRNALAEFVRKHRCRFIPDDFSPQRIAAESAKSRQFTDLYLAELAERHRMKLATLDTRIFHRATEVVS